MRTAGVLTMVDGPRLGQQLCFALYAASGAVVRAYRPLLARIGLTYPQYLVLMVLWERDDVPVHELATRLEQSSHALGPVLRRLAETGLVQRRVDPDDRRVVRISLTDEGRRLEPLASSAQMDVVCQTGLDADAYAGLRTSLQALTRTTAGPADADATSIAAQSIALMADDDGGDADADDGLFATTVAAGVPAYVIGRDGTLSAVSSAAAAMLHWSVDELVGRNAHATFHHADEQGVPAPADTCPLQAVRVRGRVARSDRDVFWRRDGAPVPVWWTAVPSIDPATRELRTTVVFDRVDATSDTGGPSHSDNDTRLLVLGQLSELLGVRDVEVGLRRVAALGASTLADWCVIDRVDDGLVTRASIADRITTQDDLDRRLMSMPALTPRSIGSLGRVLRGVDTVAVDLFVDDEPFHGLSTDALDVAQAALFTDLGAAHAFVVPLRARDHVLGAMTWVRTDPARPFTDNDVLLATVFGFRVGLWLDNARLYGQQKRLSETLQHSLLTALPELDDLQLVARYAAASEGVEVGGDWYDAHLTHDGDLAVTIGDVTGHDSDAAARMGQLRSMLRLALLDDPARPETALRRVDSAMPVLAIPGQATAVLAVVGRGGSDQPSSAPTVTWTNAGHLPPLLIDPRGECTFLDTSPDLLLGVRANPPRHAHHVQVEPGSTLVLYTDGLVERRGETLDTGLGRLLAAAHDSAHLATDELCDTLLERLAPHHERADDIALIAIGFRPEDRVPD